MTNHFLFLLMTSQWQTIVNYLLVEIKVEVVFYKELCRCLHHTFIIYQNLILLLFGFVFITYFKSTFFQKYCVLNIKFCHPWNTKLHYIVTILYNVIANRVLILYYKYKYNVIVLNNIIILNSNIS